MGIIDLSQRSNRAAPSISSGRVRQCRLRMCGAFSTYRLPAARCPIWFNLTNVNGRACLGFMLQNERLIEMRSHIEVSAIVVASLLLSMATAIAQTGEFTATVPGAVVHEGYALQDAWQNARNRASASPPVQESKSRHAKSREAMRSRHHK